MCSGSGQVQQTEQKLMNSQANLADVLSANYQTAFGEQQHILAQQAARLNGIVANPMGFSQPELAQSKTNINERAATAARQAVGAAAAYAAGRGSAGDVGGGGAEQLAGQVAGTVASEKASALSNLDVANQQMKRENLWRALSGLQGVGSAYGSAAGTAAGSEPGVANAGTNAGNLALEAGNIGFQDFGSILSGIGGLAEAGVGAYKAIPRGGGGSDSPFNS